MNLLTLALSLLILAGLFVLHLRQLDRTYWCGYAAGRDTHGLRSLPSDDDESEYAKGYKHGHAQALAKVQAEAENSYAKGYETGYTRAASDLATEMQTERGGEYHAISA
jgi:hypothetical protein